MKLKLVEKLDEAKGLPAGRQGTKSFFWKPEKKVDYLPGQFFYYTLPKLKYPDPKGATRHFSISSSPTEGEILRLTTKIRDESGYKKTLDEISIGDTIEGEGPNGTFILNDDEAGSQFFIAGGIGITPFRSMIKYATDKKLKIPIHLIYSNSTPEEIAFKKELEVLTKTNSNFELSLTITKPEESKTKWTGLTGRIDESLLKKLTTNYSLPTTNFWVCGPPPMVDAIEKTLADMNIGTGQIKSEKFTGY